MRESSVLDRGNAAEAPRQEKAVGWQKNSEETNVAEAEGGPKGAGQGQGGHCRLFMRSCNLILSDVEVMGGFCAKK